jgi:hypothetical protein
MVTIPRATSKISTAFGPKQRRKYYAGDPRIPVPAAAPQEKGTTTATTTNPNFPLEA